MNNFIQLAPKSAINITSKGQFTYSTNVEPKVISLRDAWKKYLLRGTRKNFIKEHFVSSYALSRRVSDTESNAFSIQLIWNREFPRRLYRLLFSLEYSELLYKQAFKPSEISSDEKKLLQHLDRLHSKSIRARQSQVFKNVDSLAAKTKAVKALLQTLRHEDQSR